MDRDKVKQNIVRLLDRMTDAQLRTVYQVAYHFINKL